MNRRLLGTLTVAAVLTAGPLWLWAAQDDDDNDNGNGKPATITVVGQGKASARPDTARVQAGVVTEAREAVEALEENNQAMEKLFKLLRREGIAEKDVQTSGFSVTPRYRRDQRGRRTNEIVGYEVRNQVRITVRELSKLGTLLDQLVSEGANQLYGITFSVDEPTELLDIARRRAMADARRKGELYAEEAGLKVIGVRSVSEQTYQVPRAPMVPRAEYAAAAVPVAPGEQEFRVSVTVVYKGE